MYYFDLFLYSIGQFDQQAAKGRIEYTFGGNPMATPSILAGQLTQQDLDRIESPCRLIVNYIPQSATPSGFYETFSAFGTVVNYKLV
ncbi:MAG: hypothetical protein EZS28_034890, partial [Streblomastix strix]